jgi:beta-glucanase (GH16 family)
MIYESLKDRLVNTLLQLKSWIRYIKKSQKFGTDEPNTNLMVCYFSDNFKIFDKNKWRIGQTWGRFHIGNTTQYYGDDSVYTENNYLVLDTKYLPKRSLTTWESNKKYDIDYSVGLISSLESFDYGFYEFEVELPKGIGLWPAVWLTAVDTWPPEIDILEAYSDQYSNYGKKFQTNLHFDFNPNKKNSGARNHRLLESYKRLKVSCHWTENFIKIFYNGYLVRVITSKDILKWFKDQRMSIVLNNAIRQEYSETIKDQTTEFVIYGLKAWV